MIFPLFCLLLLPFGGTLAWVFTSFRRRPFFFFFQISSVFPQKKLFFGPPFLVFPGPLFFRLFPSRDSLAFSIRIWGRWAVFGSPLFPGANLSCLEGEVSGGSPLFPHLEPSSLALPTLCAPFPLFSPPPSGLFSCFNLRGFRPLFLPVCWPLSVFWRLFFCRLTLLRQLQNLFPFPREL